MAERREDELLEGNYDGIEEYDNALPGWWLNLFYGTIVFGILYVLYYTVLGWGPTPQEILKTDMEELEALRASVKSQSARAPKVNLAMLLNDKEVLAKGKEIFTVRCVSCHGAAGEGIVGPNLTDEYWIHGSSLESIHKILVKGVLEKGMLAWEGVLSSEELNATAAYVYTLRQVKVEGKAPQGERYDANDQLMKVTSEEESFEAEEPADDSVGVIEES